MKIIKILFLIILVCGLFSVVVFSGCTTRSTSGTEQGIGDVPVAELPETSGPEVQRPARPDTLETRLEEAVGRWFDAPLHRNPSIQLKGGLLRYKPHELPIMAVQAVRLDDSIPVWYQIENWLVLEVHNIQFDVRFYEVYSRADSLRFSFSDGTVALLDDNYLAKTETGYSHSGGIPVLTGGPVQYGDHTVTCYLVLSDGTYVAGDPNRLLLYGHLIVERASQEYGMYGDH